MILEKWVVLTSYLEKDQNINIVERNAYITIIFNEIVKSLEKTDIIGKDQIETGLINYCKFSDYKYEKSGYEKLTRCFVDILIQWNKESRNKLKILFSSSKKYFNFLY